MTSSQSGTQAGTQAVSQGWVKFLSRGEGVGVEVPFWTWPTNSESRMKKVILVSISWAPESGSTEGQPNLGGTSPGTTSPGRGGPQGEVAPGEVPPQERWSPKVVVLRDSRLFHLAPDLVRHQPGRVWGGHLYLYPLPAREDVAAAQPMEAAIVHKVIKSDSVESVTILKQSRTICSMGKSSDPPPGI